MTIMAPKIIFSTFAYNYLKNEVLELGKYEEGSIQSKSFPDGEIYHKIDTEVQGRDIILIGGTIDESNTMELYDFAQGIAHQGANSLKIIIPYFGYSTMERAVKPGEIVKAKNRALLFSSIPMCAEANQVFLMDLHSEGIPYYFDRDIRCTHLYCKQIILDTCQKLYGSDFILAATDAGRAKWVESLAFEMGVKSAFVYKERKSGSETHITGINADVKNRKVIIYDDMIRTGGSLMQAAQIYRDAGAIEIIALTTHGLFSNQALEKIAAQGIISKVYATNSHPNSNNQQSNLLEINSIASIIYQVI